MSAILHGEVYPAPHNPRKTVFRFEGACKHDKTILVVFEFFDYIVEDIVDGGGDFDELVQQAVNERCRQDHHRTVIGLHNKGARDEMEQAVHG